MAGSPTETDTRTVKVGREDLVSVITGTPDHGIDNSVPLRSRSASLARTVRPAVSRGRLREWQRKKLDTRAVDVHSHSFVDDGLNARIVRWARAFGIVKTCVSFNPYEMGGTLNPTQEEVERANGRVLRLQKEHEEVDGFVHVNPLNQRSEAMTREYLERRGFVGIKVYRATRVRSHAIDPIADLAIKCGAPMLVHTAHRLYPRSRPNESEPRDIVSLAKRFPRMNIIMAHIGGGGDWEYAIEEVSRTPNIYVDTGGSVADCGMIEAAVDKLGVERVLFATDVLTATSVAKIEDAELSADQKAKIYGENARRVVPFR